MNFAGQPLLSRQTLAAGRSLFLLSIAMILTIRLEIDTAQMRIFEVPITSEHLHTTALVSLPLLQITLVVHWLAGISSLVLFNALSRKQDSQFSLGDFKTRRCEIESALYRLKHFEDKSEDAQIIRELVEKFERIDRDRWRYQIAAYLYVVFWGFAVPVCLSFVAFWTVLDA